jgi:hypothetical protein
MFFRTRRSRYHNKSSKRRQQVLRPRIEALEQRTVLSTVFWSNAAGGVWETPGNWSTGYRPGPADDVVINNLNSGATITHQSDSTVIHSLTTNLANPATFAFSGGSLTVLATSVLDSHTTLNLTGGAIGGPGEIDLNGLLTWSNGEFFGSGVTNARGGIQSSSGKDEMDGHVLNNYGPATFTGSGFLDAFDGSVINNEPGAMFQARNDQRFQSFRGQIALFNNMGTFQKSASTGTTNLSWVVNNTGTIDAQTGTVTLDDGGTSSGNFIAELNATLNFDGGIHHLTSASSVSGAGTVAFGGGITEIQGSYAVTGITSNTGGTANFSGTVSNVGTTLNIGGLGLVNFYSSSISVANFNMDRGTLLGVGDVRVTTALAWTGGTMGDTGSTTLTSGALLTITGGNDKGLDGRTLNLTSGATARWTGGNLFFSNGATVNNQAGAVFNIQNNQSLSASGALSAFNNAGSLLQNNSTGTASLGTPFYNTGSVDVQTGTLIFGLGGAASGSFTAGAGATLAFSGGVEGFLPSSSVSGAGTVNFSGGTNIVDGTYAVTGTSMFTGGTTEFPAAISSIGNSVTVSGPTNMVVNFETNSISVGTFTLIQGNVYGGGDIGVTTLMQWSGGTLADTGSTTLQPGAVLTINGANGEVLSGRTLNLSSGVVTTWTGTGDLGLWFGATVNNQAGATFNVENNQTFSNNQALGVFNNAGTFQKLVSTGTTTMTAIFNNSGTVDVQTGTLNLNASGLTTGSDTVESDATLTINNINVYYGFTTSSSIGGAGTVNFNGGYTEVDGSYAVTGSTIFSQGTSNLPGAVSSVGVTLTVNGNNPTVDFGGSSFSVGQLTLSTGTLWCDGAISVTTTMSWTGGTLVGTGTTSLGAGATLTISGGNDKALDGESLSLTNGATGTWTGGNLVFYDAASFNNQAGATFTIQTNQTLSTSGALSAFRNGGSLIQNNSTGTANLGTPLFNSGTVDVQTGTLLFSGGGSSSGLFTAEAGATLGFNGGITSLLAASTANGAGTVRFSGGSTEVDGTYAVTGTTSVTGGNVSFPTTITSLGTILNINGGSQSTVNFENNAVAVPTFTFASGTITGGGDVMITSTLIWTGGTMANTGSTTVATGATVTISGPDGKALDGRTLNLSAGVTTTWTGTGDLALFDGAVINNAAGATFLVENNQTFANSGSVLGVINNAGTFQKTLSTGTTTVNAVFNNTGTTDVATGTLLIDADGVATGGAFTVENAANLSFSVYWYFIDSASSITGAGSVTFVFSFTSIDIAGQYAITGSTQVNSQAAVNFLANASSGPFSNSGSVTITPGTTLTVSGTYLQSGSSGPVTNLDSATLTATLVNLQGGAFVAAGVINGNFQSNATLNIGSTYAPGLLTINGSYTQMASGVLNVRIGGTSAGTQFDQLQVNGQASLAGTLNVSLVNNYLPAIGVNFDIIDFTSETGTFATMNGLANLGGTPPRHFDPTITASTFTLMTVMT